MRDSQAFGFLLGLFIFMLLGNVMMIVMLTTGRLQTAFAAGLTIDALVLLIGWGVTTWLLADSNLPNNAYIFLMPLLVGGVIRLGWPLGVAQGVLFAAWVVAANLILLDPGAYLSNGFTLRTGFMLLTTAVTIWFVSQMRTERSRTDQLWYESEAIARIGRLVSSSDDLDEIYSRFSAAVSGLIPNDRVSVLMKGSARGAMNLRYAGGKYSDAEERTQGHVFELSLAGYAAETGGAVRVSAGASGAAGLDAVGVQAQPPFCSSMCAPIHHEGQVIGALSVHSMNADEYHSDQEGLIERIADQIAGTLASDISHALQVELIEQQHQLEVDNEEFISAVSHELKTPMVTVMAFVDMIKSGRSGPLTPAQIDHIKVIERNGRRMLSMVDDLLDISMFHAGTLSIEFSEFELGELLDELVAEFIPSLAEKRQKFDLGGPITPVWVEADRGRIGQVLRNLLSNASKYSPEGTSIFMTVCVEVDRLGIAVRDEGIGIHFDSQRDLFDPFFRAKDPNVQAESGSGLGLAVARSVVERHGGEITVESDRDAAARSGSHSRFSGMSQSRPMTSLNREGRLHSMAHIMLVSRTTEERAELAKNPYRRRPFCSSDG